VIALLGAPGSGKSTLTDALLGRPADGSARGLRHGSVDHAGATVHLLDPPGDPELAAPLAAALRAASAALLVVSPLQGLDPRTVLLAERAEEAGLPVVVVVSQLDRPGADADEATALVQRLLGDQVLPVHLPLHDDDGVVAGVLDLLRLEVHVPDELDRPADPEHAELVAGLRSELLEAVLVGGDEAAFERWLDTDEEPAVLDLPGAVARGDLTPLLVTSPLHGVGRTQLLDLLAALPAARDQEPPAAEDAQGDPVHLGDSQAETEVAEVVWPGLARVWAGPRTGHVVAAEGSPGSVLTSGDWIALAPWDAPEPQFPVGVRPDDDLAARVDADPLARLEPDRQSGQLLLWTTGPAHAELLLDGLPSQPVELVGARTGIVAVAVPPAYERQVRSDATARGGAVLADGRIKLPATELAGYALALGRVSAWTATFTRESGPLSP
jgi:elongation factor G